MPHFMQSTAWEAFQNSLGNKTLRREGEGWSWLAVVETQVFGPVRTRRLYSPYGPFFCDGRGLATALGELEAAGRREGAVFVRVEPQASSPDQEEGMAGLLARLGYRRVAHLLPEDTWRLDVSVGADAVLRGMEKGNRKRYRQAAGKGVRILRSTDPADVPLLAALMGEVEERNGTVLRDADYIRRQAEVLFPLGAARLYLAFAPDAHAAGSDAALERCVAANFVFLDDEAVCLIHNGSDSAYYKTGANVAMQVQIVLDAADEGRRWADFHGMAPEGAGPEHPWYGFTKFKKTFGGEARHYLGTWEKPLRGAHYAVYDLARKVIAHK